MSSASAAGFVMDASQKRDRELLQRITRADTEAFRSLFARYAPNALALALRIVRDRPLAEEAVQEAFLEVWRGRHRYKESRGSVRAWIMTWSTTGRWTPPPGARAAAPRR